MAVPYPPPPVAPSTENDIFSISDAHLAQRYKFIREIGAGNWGCVWLCSPKGELGTEADNDDAHRRVAVKLVFREKKPTTAQRVRSLWNEMKIVRALKHDPHPSIVPFHSFIITPSFAIITMEYLPHLIPVEVPEHKAREWFRCLLSAVLFLHTRGVVHNDIKPANILLSREKIPVLVDFGFAERYEMTSKRAFLSNLAYGTPEYLSPERARGNVHDTRKSDMWSLGITFFEILIGRTPFEYVEGEKFTTPDDLERYWSRTVKGKWVGEWKMSKGVERLLRKMVSPNADIRITATEAIQDAYWTDSQIPVPHKDDGDADVSTTNILKGLSPVVQTPPKKLRTKPSKLVEKENVQNTVLTESKQARAAARAASVAQQTLPPIEGSPFSPKTTAAKENAPPRVNNANRAAVVKGMKGRGPSVRKPVPAMVEEPKPSPRSKRDGVKEREAKERNRKGRVLSDLTDRARNIEPAKRSPVDFVRSKEKPAEVKMSAGRDRVMAFERLKEQERSRFLEEEEDDDVEEKEQEVILPAKRSSSRLPTPTSAGLSTKVDEAITVPDVKVNRKIVDLSFSSRSDFKDTLASRPSEDSHDVSPMFDKDGISQLPNESTLSFFKHGIKVSIDKTLRLYKSSTLGRTSKQSACRRTSEDSDPRLAMTRRESWEDESFIRHAKSSLPVVRHAIRAERVAADNKVDRMSMWIRNVEQVVKEVQENFASSEVKPLPALPARPVSRPVGQRNGRPPRMPRRIIPADQIFRVEVIDPTSSSISPSDCNNTPDDTNVSTMFTVPSEEPSRSSAISPPRPRRATISSVNPSSPAKRVSSNSPSPSKRKEKARSSNNLNNLVRPISPLSQLQRELEQEESHVVPSLCSVLDRSVFIARSGSIPPLHEVPSIPTIPNMSIFSEHEQSNGFSSHSGRYNAQPSENQAHDVKAPVVLTSPTRRHIEGVYDRFLMATTGVKRVGRGYQSDMSAPIQNLPSVTAIKKNGKLFSSGRRAMPPPVSSEDINRLGPIDDFGNFTISSSSADAHNREDAGSAVRAVTKAFKAIVAGKTVARRQSKVM